MLLEKTKQKPAASHLVGTADGLPGLTDAFRHLVNTTRSAGEGLRFFVSALSATHFGGDTRLAKKDIR